MLSLPVVVSSILYFDFNYLYFLQLLLFSLLLLFLLFSKMINYCEYRHNGNKISPNTDINYSEDNVLTVCHELNAQDLRHSEKSVAFAKLVIQKLFRDSNVDLCSIMQPTTNSSDHPFNLVHNLIHSKSSFFETILDADDSLSNELWIAIGEQADRTHQPVVQSADSVMMQCISYYVTRLLPIDATPIQLMRPCSEQSQRVRTPLDLFMPNSPVLNRIKFDSPDFFSSSLHPRHLTVFCNFVSILCSTDQFPSANRLMILRYLLKQFHVFCLHEGNDPDLASIKSTLHSRPPFSPHLYSFLYTFFEQCPTISLFKDLVQCWTTFCRPWRYVDSVTGSVECGEISTALWMPFVRVHEKYYRVLLGKLLRRLTMFDISVESTRVVRVVVESSWKEPMCRVLRDLGIDPRPHTCQLLNQLAEEYKLKTNMIAVRRNEHKKQSLWKSLITTPESPFIRSAKELIENIEPILRDSDSSIGTSYMVDEGTSSERCVIETDQTTPVLTDTPKRPLKLPDHNKDPVTGLMYLTPLGRKQVISGERRFDFSSCSHVLPKWKTTPKPYECAVFVAALGKVNEYLNKTWVVKALGNEYAKETVMGTLSRFIMDPPCPNVHSPISSPVFSKTLKVTPPSLRIRVFANYSVMLSILITVLYLKYGWWALVPVVLGGFITLMARCAQEIE